MTTSIDSARLRSLAVALVLAYATALGTLLGGVGRLVGFVVPVAVGWVVATRNPPATAARRLAGFSLLIAISAAVAAFSMADVVLEGPSPNPTGFVIGSFLLVGVLGAIASLVGASFGAAQRARRSATRSATIERIEP